ncbi:hypothetical protein [Paraoerskovia marina]|uniref:hypothetical protein n=1 Tax=Paraoerskovia marina TaxID=545619 RepID=UPI000492245E|nr:hypothetical protein [Paraoerskovia marina]
MALYEARLPHPDGKKHELRIFMRAGTDETVLPLASIRGVDVRSDTTRAVCNGTVVTVTSIDPQHHPARRMDWLPDPVRAPLVRVARRAQAKVAGAKRG